MTATPRPKDSAILGVSMPLELKLRIQRLAKKEDRTMANWTALKLREIVAALEQAQEAQEAQSSPPPIQNTTTRKTNRIAGDQTGRDSPH